MPAADVLDSGADTKKFLQGLTTNDMNKLEKPNDCVATAFLTPKGRILATALLYQTADSVLVETHADLLNELKRYLTMYKLRAQAKIEAVDCAVRWDSDSAQLTDEQVICSALDPRIEGFGRRTIVAGTMPVDAAQLDRYELRNLQHGLAEGPELSNRIPLEVNLDLLHHIAFDKGCYVGQELTARTKYKGLVRKRMVPFVASSSATTAEVPFGPLASQQLVSSASVMKAHSKLHLLSNVRSSADGTGTGTVSSSSQAIGEVVQAAKHSIGLALVNLETLFTASNCQFAVVDPSPAAEEGAAVEEHAMPVVGYATPFRPQWFTGLDEKTNLPV